MVQSASRFVCGMLVAVLVVLVVLVVVVVVVVAVVIVVLALSVQERRNLRICRRSDAHCCRTNSSSTQT